MVTASRGDFDATLIGSVAATTDPAPRPRVTLELPKHGKVEFLPTNRDAVLTVAGARSGATLVPLPVEGAYSVRPAGGHFLIRGDENAGGFVALRFGYRIDGLPPELANLDVAVLSDRVQRAVREASVPAPFSTTAEEPEPLIELVCADARGKPQRVPPSTALPVVVRQQGQLPDHRSPAAAEARIRPARGDAGGGGQPGRGRTPPRGQLHRAHDPGARAPNPGWCR